MRLLVSGGLASSALLVLVACAPTVGTACDESRARTVVYDPSGTPAYAGQSILITSCAGGGSFCHAAGAMNRYGAPAGMNFDLTLADDARFADEATGARHLYGDQLNSHHLRDSIYEQVVDGEMPPGAIGRETMRPAYIQYASATDTVGMPVPDIRTADGREILRNWLACGSPVVEATTDPTAIPCTSDNDCTLTHHCDTTRSECFGVGAIEPVRGGTAMPTWSSIYPSIIQPQCAISVCHGTVGAAASGNLDLSTAAAARAALVGVAADTATCGTRIVAGNPDMSFFVQKLEGTQNVGTCGDTMPIGGMLSAAQITLIRQWITNGAMMD